MQIAEYVGDRRQRIVKYVGSAHTAAELGVVMARARQLLEEHERPGQGGLDLGLDVAPAVDLLDEVPESGVLDLSSTATVRPAARVLIGPGRVVDTASGLLFDVLAGVYDQLGFDALGDEVFRDLVVARIVEPTSLLDIARVLGELGRPAASYNTMRRTLGRCAKDEYRDQVAELCFAHAQAAGDISLVLYDVTTLYFEVEKEDALRKVGLGLGP